MSLTDEERRVMVELEIERAQKITEQFETLREQQYWDTLVNRMYYAAFHAVSALLIHNGLHVHTHRGALNIFNKEFVRAGVFSVEEGHLFSKLESTGGRNYRSTSSIDAFRCKSCRLASWRSIAG